jgi:hypothetical protein
MRCFYAPPQGMNMLEHPTDQEPPASIQQHNVIISISTSVVELIERVILRDLTQLTMATGSSSILLYNDNYEPLPSSTSFQRILSS